MPRAGGGRGALRSRHRGRGQHHARGADGGQRARADRLAAATYGLATADIATVLRTALAGTNVGVYRHAGDEYDMVVRYQAGPAEDPGTTWARSRSPTPWASRSPSPRWPRFLRTDSPQEILRRDRQNVATISANIAGRPLGAITADMQAELPALRIPFGYSVSYGGDQQNMTSSFRSLGWALVASLVLVST